MDFNKLNEMIPYAKGGKAKILEMHPYTGITLALPGRHALETEPIGGDFVVMVDDEDMDWTKHQFTHTDLFKDVQSKIDEHSADAVSLIALYKLVIEGADPTKMTPPHFSEGINAQTFLYAVQCLAVAEHRRYAKFESKFGGRFLPFRFAAGIVEELWTAADAAGLQRKGRPGCEMLERLNGVPKLTRELMGMV